MNLRKGVDLLHAQAGELIRRLERREVLDDQDEIVSLRVVPGEQGSRSTHDRSAPDHIAVEGDLYSDAWFGSMEMCAAAAVLTREIEIALVARLLSR